MPKQTTHVRVVRQWCQSLGVLSAVSMSRQDAEMRLAAFVPMLLDRFPDEAFTTASLQHVAAHAVKGFPTYGELADWLSEWWRDNRPRPVAIAPPAPKPEPPREPLTPEALARIHAVVVDLAYELRAPPLVQVPLAPRHLNPTQLIEAYRNAGIAAPARPASATADASAATVDPGAA
jgi:hypothetical protein